MSASGKARHDRRAVGLAVHRGKAARRFDQRAEPGPLTRRAGLSPARRCARESASDSRRCSTSHPSPMRSSVPGTNDSITTSNRGTSRSQQLRALGGLQVERDVALVAARTPSTRTGRPPTSTAGADRRARLFDLDDVGAEVGRAACRRRRRRPSATGRARARLREVSNRVTPASAGQSARRATLYMYG